MRLSLIFQVVLTSIIIGIIIIFYYSFISDKKTKTINPVEKKDKEIEKIIEDEITNELLNIEYNSFDNRGNSFYINAEKATVDLEYQKQNKIKLEKVTSVINLKNKGIINVYSNYAIYEKINHDTLFYGDVKIEYLDNVINSENLDVLFTKDISKIYNNVVYNSYNTSLNTDIVLIDMITGDVNLEMLNNSEKVRFKTNHEFN